MPLPNFFLIGPPKAGSTSLYHLLRQHPAIYMSPVKESKFMAYDPGTVTHPVEREVAYSYQTLDAYARLYANAGGATAIGDASVLYWFFPAAPRNIQSYAPNARIMAVLRHPVERFYSHYIMYRMNGEEPRSAETVVAENCSGIVRALRPVQNQYVQIGYYHQRLQSYWERFPREQIGLWLFDDLKKRPQHLLQSMFAFLDVDTTFEPDTSIRYNPSGIPRNKTVHWLTRKRWWTTLLRETLPKRIISQPYAKLMRMKQNNLEKPPLDLELRQRLLALYREDTLRLQDTLQRDLSTWLT